VIESQINEEKKEQRAVYLPAPFSKEEIEAENRQPKRKVAVMIGYSGSGYKGMQLMPDQRTIEGDLFQAFVAAGAISKANADDPKKSSLVRCARTDKGVHAAGNVISLKLIIEDPDIISKINSHLDPRIRVWGIQRTTSGFNCYNACDSRWYEYLIPTHSFLPPHPSSWLAKQLAQIAAEDGKTAEVNERQQDVLNFWKDVERDYIRPILEGLNPEIRELVEQALYKTDSIPRDEYNAVANMLGEEDGEGYLEDAAEQSSSEMHTESQLDTTIETNNSKGEENYTNILKQHHPELETAMKSIKAAYISAKRAYRISPSRIEQVRSVLATYEGTHNFHNFTIRKSANDPSAQRFIKSFQVNGDPVIINNSEWLSLKVHGQSFMMHQIRKMVGMVALVVRSGTPIERMDEAMSNEPISIPKAPGLGLLLERPVFESYNKMKAVGNNREEIDFTKYEENMLAFKQREIYDRIFEEEEKDLM
jgi:tRNA pseudouridine38-40 synthase